MEFTHTFFRGKSVFFDKICYFIQLFKVISISWVGKLCKLGIFSWNIIDYINITDILYHRWQSNGNNTHIFKENQLKATYELTLNLDKIFIKYEIR